MQCLQPQLNPLEKLYITAIQNIISIDSVSGANYQWFLNDTIITNANSSEYYVTKNVVGEGQFGN